MFNKKKSSLSVFNFKTGLKKTRITNLPGLLAIVFIIAIGIGGCKKDDQQMAPPAEKKWLVTTVAGNGSAAFSDGPSLSAEFRTPSDIAIAADGTMYVADADNNRVRKIIDGKVVTFVGNGNNIFANGNGLSAQFQYPYSIALDANGNLYVSDLYPTIRKISPDADVITYAGTQTQGFADGNADTARFYPGNTMVADAQGNIYSADVYNCRIRKISISGKVSTIAGSGDVGFSDGNATEAQFHFPGGIVIDHQGNLYVADRGNYRIRKITPDGHVSTFAGSGTRGINDGTAATAQFLQLSDLVIDNNGNLYATDRNRIRKISPQGDVTTIAGSLIPGYQDGDATSALFSTPSGLGMDVQGNIYVADTYNNRIRKLSFE